MENELVKQFKKEVAQFDEELRLYYEEALVRGAEEEDIDDLVGLMSELTVLVGTTKATLPSRRIIFENIKKKFADKKAYIDAYLDQEEEETYEATVVPAKESTKGKAGKVIAWALSIALLTGAAVHTGLILKNKLHGNNSCDTTNEETIETTESEDRSTGTIVLPEVPVENTLDNNTQENTRNLMPGEYGTFLDVTDNEQVQARAQYLYDTYFAPNMKYIDEGDRHLITVENIANTIRVMNGELPLDENGYPVMDGVTVDDYTAVLLAMTVNNGSTYGEPYYHFPAHLLTVDGSEASEFIKSYDESYDKLVYAMNAGDDEQARDAIACLGYKFWNEWYLQGMYGGVNPHSFDSDLKYFTFIATVEPYNTTALEWHLSEKEPVCIEACVDYETQEKDLLSVNDIHVALETGEWNQIGARLAGMDVENNPWLPLYWEDLNDQLEWKYEHRDALTLK